MRPFIAPRELLTESHPTPQALENPWNFHIKKTQSRETQFLTPYQIAALETGILLFAAMEIFRRENKHGN